MVYLLRAHVVVLLVHTVGKRVVRVSLAVQVDLSSNARAYSSAKHGRVLRVRGNRHTQGNMATDATL